MNNSNNEEQWFPMPKNNDNVTLISKNEELIDEEAGNE